ncbi:MAG: isopenicillin N synthase family dioxygenase [Acidimicrobiales bacterium]
MGLLSVPVVDLSPWVAGGSDRERSRVVADTDKALREVGFLQIVGHGVTDDVVAAMAGAADAFFAMSLDAKSSYRVQGANRGYTPPRAESLILSAGIEADPTSRDFFEAFNIGVDGRSYGGRELPEPEYAPNIWPEELPQFRGNIQAYFEEAGRVARLLTSIFDVALGQPEGFFAGLTDHSIDVLRLNNYALAEGTSLGAVSAMGAHTDFGIVTVLWADAVPGLQILDAGGGWHDVLPATGALLVNLGDLTARMTNDVWMSTMHRVVPPQVDGRTVRRRSAAYFHDGNFDAVVAPLPQFVDATRPAGYEPVRVADHLKAKLAGSREGLVNTSAVRESARLQASLG